MSGTRTNITQIRRTPLPNNPPAAGVLLDGELCVEQNTPVRLWVGVPTFLDPTGRKLLLDTTAIVGGSGIGEAPADGSSYGRMNTTWTRVLPLTGGSLTGNLTVDGNFSATDWVHVGATGSNNYVSLQAPEGAAYWTGIEIGRATGQYGTYYSFNVGGSSRWSWEIGTQGGDDETGSNAGSNFHLRRYNDAGVELGASPALKITRATGVVDFAVTPTVGGVPIGGSGSFLPLAGGTLSGGLSFGSSTVSLPTDLSRHLALYGTTFGINCTPSIMNILAGGSVSIYPNGATRTAYFNSTGLTLDTGKTLLLSGDPTLVLHAATKQYVDYQVGAVASAGVTAIYYQARTTSQAEVDPTSGHIAWNTASPSINTATQLYIHGTSSQNVDWTLFWMALQVGQKIVVEDRTDHSLVLRWLISGTIVLHGTGANAWVTVPVTPYGTTIGTVNYVNNQSLIVAVVGIGGDQFLPIEGGEITGGLKIDGALALSLPAAKTGTAYTVAAADCSLILNPSGTFTLTLPTASSYSGRILRLKLVAAFAVNSASSNVIPLAGGSAGTAIMAATAGKFCTLQSDGTNWQIMSAN